MNMTIWWCLGQWEGGLGWVWSHTVYMYEFVKK